MLVSDNKLKWLVLSGVLLLGGILLLFSMRTQEKQRVALDLPTLGGERVQIPDPQGRLTWVNLWSASCAACLQEMPDLETLHREQRSRLQVIAVAMPDDPPNMLVETQARLQLGLPIVLDLQGQAARQLAPERIVPVHHLLDAQGRILYSVRGGLNHTEMLAILIRHKPLDNALN